MVVSKVEKTQMQVDVELYKELVKLRRLRGSSRVRYEPLRCVVQWFLDFHLANRVRDSKPNIGTIPSVTRRYL